MHYEMEELVLPEGLKTIGKYAFAESDSGQIEVPSTVTSIGNQAFDDNANILYKGSAQQWIDIHNTDTSNYPPRKYVTYTGDGCGFIKEIGDKDSISYRLFSWGDATGQVVVPSEFRNAPVTGIDSFAFQNNTEITSVVIPDSVVEIESWGCFSGCSNLENVELNALISFLPYEIFYKCTNLISVSLPYTITSIGDRAFYQCTSIKNKTLYLQ